MSTAENTRALGALRDAIALLASPPQAQRVWLHELGTAPLADELALEFDDAFRLVPTLEDAGELDALAVSRLTAVSQALSKIPPGNEGWLEAALDDPAWESVRGAAGLALVSLLIATNGPRIVAAV